MTIPLNWSLLYYMTLHNPSFLLSVRTYLGWSSVPCLVHAASCFAALVYLFALWGRVWMADRKSGVQRELEDVERKLAGGDVKTKNRYGRMTLTDRCDTKARSDLSISRLVN
jgi:hypothetical protein